MNAGVESRISSGDRELLGMTQYRKTIETADKGGQGQQLIVDVHNTAVY
jgi:hypothetical protein